MRYTEEGRQALKSVYRFCIVTGVPLETALAMDDEEINLFTETWNEIQDER